MAEKKTKLRIEKYDGTSEVVEVTGYNAKQLREEVKRAHDNSSSDYSILIGDDIFDVRDVKNYVTVKDEK